MSKQSNRKNQQLKAAKKAAEEAKQKATNSAQSSSGPPNHIDPQQKQQKVGITNWKKLVTLVIAWGTAVLINKVSGGVWAWWIPAGALCIWIFDATRSFRLLRLVMIPVYVGIIFSTNRIIEFVSRDIPPAKPHLQLGICSQVAPEDTLWLTNASLIVPLQSSEDGPISRITESNSWILLPMKSNVITSFVFQLENTSTNWVESVHVRVIFGWNVDCAADSGWRYAKYTDGSVELRWSTENFGDAPDSLPPIRLGFSKAIPVAVEVSGKNFSPIWMGFWLSVFTPAGDIRPQIAKLSHILEIREDGSTTNKAEALFLTNEHGSFTYTSPGIALIPVHKEDEDANKPHETKIQ